MLYLLGELSKESQIFNLFRYITFRTGAVVTAMLVVFVLGPWLIDSLRMRQGKGQPIREDGPKSHLITKKGTPTMGSLMILLGLCVADGALGEPFQPVCLDRSGCHALIRAHRLLRRLSEGIQAHRIGVFRAVPSF